MSWAKLDDQFHDDPRFDGLSDAAINVWIRIQSRIADMKTDGLIATRDLGRIEFSRSIPDQKRSPMSAVMEELVARGLLIPAEEGYRDPTWLERNPPQEELALESRWGRLRSEKSLARGRGDKELLGQIEGEENRVKNELWDLRSRRKLALSERSPNAQRTLTDSRPVPVPSPRRGKGVGTGAANAATAAPEGARGDAALMDVTRGNSLAWWSDAARALSPDEVMECGVCLGVWPKVWLANKDNKVVACLECIGELYDDREDCAGYTKPKGDQPARDCRNKALKHEFFCKYHNAGPLSRGPAPEGYRETLMSSNADRAEELE